MWREGKEGMREGKGVYSTFKRKLVTFRRDPLGSSCEKMREWSNRFNQELILEKVRIHINQLCQQWAEHQLRKRGWIHFFEHRPSAALPPDFADLWYLYRTVRKRLPRCILEFGSGCSTIILAQALVDNEGEPTKSGGLLYSLEGDPYWAEVTRRSIPVHLQRVIEIWNSPLLEVEYLGTPAFRYSKVPDVTPDFVYLDGPALTPVRRVACDILDIEDRFRPGLFLVVDGRMENTRFLREHFKKKYLFHYRSFFRNSIFELRPSCNRN